MADSVAFLSTQFLPTFIDAYREHECLWAVRSKDYSNRAVKAKAYNELTELTRSVVPGCDATFIKRKIEILRGSFRREYRKVRESLRAGGEVYAPKLWYYPHLLFLKDQDDAKRAGEEQDPLMHVKLETEVSVDGDEDTTYEAEPNMAEDPSTPASPLYGLLKRPRYDTEQSFQSRQPQDRVQEDEYDRYAAVVAGKLRKMNPVQELFAENLINQILFQGLLGRLQESSTISHS